MMDALWALGRPLLFSLDAETAHHLTLRVLGSAPRLLGALARPLCGAPARPTQLFGHTLPSPIGLAAGLDKDGVAIPFWPALGFGFIEIGTVTAHPQVGNPKPRMFRLVDQRAIINRMGFNNGGSAALAADMERLKSRGHWPSVPVGANIGKSKITPLEDAAQDYATSTRRLADVADYFTVNVSSPNTPGLRSLQDAEPLRRILDAVLAAANGTPTALKLAPDLTDEAIHDAVELAHVAGIDAIIATNTTIRRDLLIADPNQGGGMSGAPLWPFARDRIQVALAASAGRIPVVGVGGIETATQVEDLLDAGCVAVQLYSSLIFQGPGLIRRLRRDGHNAVSAPTKAIDNSGHSG